MPYFASIIFTLILLLNNVVRYLRPSMSVWFHYRFDKNETMTTMCSCQCEHCCHGFNNLWVASPADCNFSPLSPRWCWLARNHLCCSKASPHRHCIMCPFSPCMSTALAWHSGELSPQVRLILVHVMFYLHFTCITVLGRLSGQTS